MQNVEVFMNFRYLLNSCENANILIRIQSNTIDVTLLASRPPVRPTDRPTSHLQIYCFPSDRQFSFRKNKTFPYWSMDDVKTIGRIESKFSCHTGITCQNIFYSTRILCFKKYMKRLWHTISYRIKMILIMFRSCTRHQFEHFHFILSTYFENCYA